MEKSTSPSETLVGQGLNYSKRERKGHDERGGKFQGNRRSPSFDKDLIWEGRSSNVPLIRRELRRKITIPGGGGFGKRRGQIE